MRALADVLSRLDRSEECREILEQALEISGRTLGEDNPDTLLSTLLARPQISQEPGYFILGRHDFSFP
jgi:hypothetical protein